MSRLLITLVLLHLASTVYCMIDDEAKRTSLCDRSFCTCPNSGHPSWITVNCSVSTTQTLDLYDWDIPEETTDIYMNGLETLSFASYSLSHLKDVRRLSISDVKLVVLRKFAAANLNVVSTYIEIENCHVLRVEEKAFFNIRGLENNGTDYTESPLTVIIRNCNYVTLEGSAFSWLLKISIRDVQTLTLSPGAFMLDPTAANVGEHGPGMSIELTNVTVPEIPGQTFGSSAAEIIMKKVAVQAVRRGAFAANTYNVIKATDSSFHLISGEAFAQNSHIINLYFRGCNLHQLMPRAIQSAISKLEITNTRFGIIDTGSINTTVASVRITDSEFHRFFTRGIEFSSWNKIYMQNIKFDGLPPNAILAPASNVVNELVFVDNEVESVTTNSLGFIGQTFASKFAVNVVYRNNYFGVSCNCNVSKWLADAMGSKDGGPYNAESYCTVNLFFARCFNVPEQNMLFKTFLDKVCSDKSDIQCEKYRTKAEVPKEIKNPRFPHKKDEDTLSDRDKKVIGIVIVTALGCIIIVMFISLIRWMKRRGYCASIKNLLMSSNSSCGTICGRLCACGRNNGIDNSGSISQMSVHEFSERRRLNEPRVQETLIMETVLPGTYTEEEPTPMDDKTTQTLPEELTKELLENLKEKLEDPENYVEAREMIEHLYELIKVEESCNTNSPVALKTEEENIYELPFQNTTPRIGKNKKQMISVGTKAPSLEKLLPLSPYNRETALAHEYFEPKDFAVHLYAEITNCDKEKRSLLGNIPDIVEQVVPRGPYLRSVREKTFSPTTSPSPTPINSPVKSQLSSPVKSPLSSPVKSPLTSPVKSALTSPVKSLLTSPINSAMTSPVKSPLTSPVKSPLTSPVKSAFSSPVKSALSSPVKSPLTSPTKSHVVSPVLSLSSIKSTTSGSSGKMVNRPLPEKPPCAVSEEGTSVASG